MSKPAAKRARIEITMAEKKALCQFKVKNSKATYDDMMSWFKKSFDKPIGRSTVGDIIRAKDKWMGKNTSTKVLQQCTRDCSPKYQQLEDALFIWLNNMISKHVSVSDMMLVEKAKQFGADLGITDFGYSNGSLQGFKERRGIKSHTYHGESESADMTLVQEGREALQQTLSRFMPDDIYNMDETGLFFRLGPNRTLATGAVKGTKKKKDRLTVALCCNATGTDKLTPLVIGKSKRPRCFGKKGTFNPEIYVQYLNNTKAWMTSPIYQQWLRDLDRRMRRANRHICLLVDNAPSHIHEGLELTNVTAVFLPPNTTAHLQPCDAGIIKNFKLKYRMKICKLLIALAEDGEPLTITVRQALVFIREAWDEVMQTTIANCWSHTEIQPKEGPQPAPAPAPAAAPTAAPAPQAEVQQLATLISNLPDSMNADMSAEQFIDMDATLETEQLLSDSDILDLVTDPCDDPATPDSDECDPEPECEPLPPVTRRQARGGLSDAIRFIEQQASSEDASPELMSSSAELIRQLRSALASMDTQFKPKVTQKPIDAFFSCIPKK